MALTDYEEAMKSYIHDEDKLVTYKWLSKEFEVHVNIAKDLLKQYWEKNKDKESIVATFLIVGQLNDGSIRVEVVKDENLIKAKSKFVKLDCEHLYSLQKSLADIELLALAGDGDIRFSAIKCQENYLRTDEEVEKLRYVGNKKSTENKPANKIVNNSEKQGSKQIDSSIKEKTTNEIIKKDESSEKEKSKNEKSIESKTEEKAQVPEKKISPKGSSKNTSKSNSKVSKKPIQSKQSGFNNLFGKTANKPQVSDKAKSDSDSNNTKKEESKDLVEKVSKESIENDQSNKQEKDTASRSSELENKSKKSEEKSKSFTKAESKSTKPKSKKDSRGKKRNRSEEKNAVSKRKRIVVMDSSEDESDKSNNEEEEEEPMEIEEPVKFTRKRSPSPLPEKRENGKRMVSKYIDKTFKDEDGFLVTKRVQVYEAVSDTEEPEEIKKEESKKPKTVDTNTKKKQTTLTNFFKKP